MDLCNNVPCHPLLRLVWVTPVFVCFVVTHPEEMSILRTSLRVFAPIATMRSPIYRQKAIKSKRPSFHALQKVKWSQNLRNQEYYLDAQTEASVISPHILSTKGQEVTGYLLFPPHIKRSKLEPEDGSPTCMLHSGFVPTTRLFFPLYTK